MPYLPPGHVQQLTTQTASLDAFSNVDECIFLFQQYNVICQALLDSWGDSGNPCTIYTLLTAPLDTLTIYYSGTSSASLLSNAYNNQTTQFQDMYDLATAKLPRLIITSLISPHPTLTAIAFQYIIIMIGHPQCSHYDTALMFLHVIVSLWSQQSVPMMGRSLKLSPVPNTFLRQEPHYIHDETSDTSNNSDLTHIDGHGCVLENDVSITTDTQKTCWRGH
jgi:hypothetical protein